MLLHADSEDSDQADLSLRWLHMSFCWFWHEAAQLFFSLKKHLSVSMS